MHQPKDFSDAQVRDQHRPDRDQAVIKRSDSGRYDYEHASSNASAINSECLTEKPVADLDFGSGIPTVTYGPRVLSLFVTVDRFLSWTLRYGFYRLRDQSLSIVT